MNSRQGLLTIIFSLSMMPQGAVDNLTPEEPADLLAYLESLKQAVNKLFNARKST